MRTWLLLLVLLACGAECAFAQDEDSTKTALPAGTRVRIEYRSAHDITVGTLVRGGPGAIGAAPDVWRHLGDRGPWHVYRRIGP